MAFQGANMGGALVSGLKAGGIGAAIGGAVGGFSKGIEAAADGRNFWSGSLPTKNMVVASGSELVKVGDGMEYSTKYAKEFSDEHFGKINGLRNLYADGRLADGATQIGDRVFDGNKQILGTTINLEGGQSDVYLYKAAFVSKEQLYLTMGHEYLHVSYHFAGLASRFSSAVEHAGIYKWQYEQAAKWNYRTLYYQNLMNNSVKYNPNYFHENFGFYTINTRP